MKVTEISSILPLLLVKDVSAFTPRSTPPLNNHFLFSSNKAEVWESSSALKAKIVPNSEFLSECTASNRDDEKWQIKDTEEKAEAVVAAKVDSNIAEPKFRVQTGQSKVDTKISDPKLRVQTGRYDDMVNSIAVPFLKRPLKLDGTHAGDIGFDPIGLSESNDIYTMMEAEIRHSRLAMLAVIGWPLSELIAPNWMLQGPNHLAPSVLNGFNPLSFLVAAGLFAGFGYLEMQTALRPSLSTTIGKKHAEDMKDVWDFGVPGDYNFDPLDLYSAFGDDAVGRKAMRELEVAHGRAAMIGITYFAFWENLTGYPIVKNNLLFEPNFLVPLLGVAYLASDFFIDIKSNDQYLLQVELNSEGAMRLTRLQNFLKYIFKEAEKSSEESPFEVPKILENFLKNGSKEATEVVKEKAYLQLPSLFSDSKR